LKVKVKKVADEKEQHQTKMKEALYYDLATGYEH